MYGECGICRICPESAKGKICTCTLVTVVYEKMKRILTIFILEPNLSLIMCMYLIITLSPLYVCKLDSFIIEFGFPDLAKGVSLLK